MSGANNGINVGEDLTSLLDHLQRGGVAPAEIRRVTAEHAASWQPHINAFTALPDATKEGTHAGMLRGIPIAFKDNINVEGEPCTCASEILKGYISPYDATAVARLKQAGAVSGGRLNMDSFGMGSTSEHSIYGAVRNPWDRDRVAGGSSGGAAAAVAAGAAWAALGSDTGGSIRQPAAFCGCVGVKPSYGRVSRYGLTAYASSLDQIGPITRSVRDAALLLGLIAGVDPKDSTSVDIAVPDYVQGIGQGVRGWRIGLAKSLMGDGTDVAVRDAVLRAAEMYRSLGADIVDIDLPHARYAVAAYYIIATAEASANLARFDGIRYGARVPGSDVLEVYENSREAGFGREVKRRIILGTYVLSSGYYDAYYLRAQKTRTLIRGDFDRAFAQCDVILSPVAPTPAYALGRCNEDPLQMYLGDACTVPVNLAGICAASIPVGHSQDGLPLGVQLMAPAFAEERLLRAAFALESHPENERRGLPSLPSSGGSL